jgi:vitamin B12 transporter
MARRTTLLGIDLRSAPMALFGACTLLISAPSRGATPNLEQVVITATRTPQTIDATLASTTVFDRAQIEASQARSVEDLLRGVEGLSIANNGGAGKLTSFFVRGAEADHLLVLLDGVKLGSATAGTTALENLPLEQIERIEFVRGPRSSLYGSEAIGGVLQLFTKRGTGPIAPSLSVGGGSLGTRQLDAGIGGSGERAWFSLRGGYVHTDGYNSCRGSSTLFAGCFTEEPDKDGYENKSATLRGGYRFGTGAEIDGTWQRGTGDVSFDGSFQNQSHLSQVVAGAHLKLPLGGLWTVNANLGRSRDDADNFLNGAYDSTFNTQRDTASLQSDVAVAPNHLLTLGADFQNDDVTSTTSYVVSTRDNRGVFAQYLGKLGALRIEASTRHDNNEQFGNSNTGSVAFGYTFSNALQLTAQYGSAFKAPTFNELYFPFFGNPNLKPERSRSAELSARGRVTVLSWRMAVYDTHIRDLVGFDSSFSPANVDRTRITGIEAGLDAPLADWTIGAASGWIKPENETPGSNFGKTLPRRAKSSVKLNVDRQFGRYLLAATFISEGERFDNPSNSRRLGSYTTVDLRGEFRLSDAVRLQARVANLFNRQYETVLFYPQAVRAAYLTVRYTGSRK